MIYIMPELYNPLITLPEIEREYTTLVKYIGGHRMILSKQHKIITDIDKWCLIIAITLFPFTRYIPFDCKTQLSVSYSFVLGILFGRASNMIVFHIISRTTQLMCILLTIFITYIIFL